MIGGEIGDKLPRTETTLPPVEQPLDTDLPQQIEERPLTPQEKRQIYIDRLVENGVSPAKAESMARRKYGL